MSKQEIIQLGKLAKEGKVKYINTMRQSGFSIEMTAKMLNISPDVVRFMERRRE